MPVDDLNFSETVYATANRHPGPIPSMYDPCIMVTARVSGRWQPAVLPVTAFRGIAPVDGLELDPPKNHEVFVLTSHEGYDSVAVAAPSLSHLIDQIRIAINQWHGGEGIE